MNAAQPDRQVLRRHLMALRESVTNLQSHQGMTKEIFLSDLDRRWAVERGLELAAQNALDLATHIAASLGHDVPDYAVAIDILADVGAISRDFAEAFRGVAGFRNILVHGYLRIEPAIVLGVLNDRLPEFLVLAEAIEKEYL
jgi:uncharacterized protein YutE (UPF0331/DUF86 family)